MVREFDGDPAATDSTRVLRLPGFTNRKYEADFYVRARTESTQTYHLRDFKVQFDSQDTPRHHDEEAARKQSASSNGLSQSEHDWAYAKRALARGDAPELVIQRIADYRSEDKADPKYYADHTVAKARAQLERERQKAGESTGLESPTHNSKIKVQDLDCYRMPNRRIAPELRRGEANAAGQKPQQIRTSHRCCRGGNAFENASQDASSESA